MGKQYHFIGIGGIGMSGIAKLFLQRGESVSGSDIKDSSVLWQLGREGARISIGHKAENIREADFVVYSSAVKNDNPEILEAKKKGLPLLKRAQALAELMKGRDVVTVSGSHGKTTTTSLVSCLFINAGLSPTVAIGGILRNINANAYSGAGEFFVAEADESDGSFMYYEPKYSIITNIDKEHLDYYRDFESEVSAFSDFLKRTTSGGCVFYCSDDLNLNKIIKNYRGRAVSFGLGRDADIHAQNIEAKGLVSFFDCFCKGRLIDRFSLSLAGRHNISNALSVIALGFELGIDINIIKSTLSNYKGAYRRIDVKFDSKDYMLIDDYAHHPTEIKATLSALKGLRERSIVVFQPHRYTRTKLLLDEFAGSFLDADYLVITDIYPASEPPIEGISGQALAERIRVYSGRKDIVFIPREDITGHICRIISHGDLILTLGAGDITKVCDELVEKLKR